MADSNHDQKTAREAERDVEAARANLAGSIDNLEARLSPNALVEQGIAYFRGDGRRHLDTLARNAQANPIPLVLIGIGVAWLALGSSRSSASRSVSRRAPNDRYDDPVAYGDETAAYGYRRDEYRSPSNANTPAAASGFGENAAVAPTMAGRPRTTGLGTDAPSVTSDATRDPLGSSDRVEETDPAISDDPLLRDDAIDEPVPGSKPAATTSAETDKDDPSFRDPITTAHSDLGDDKKV